MKTIVFVCLLLLSCTNDNDPHNTKTERRTSEIIDIFGSEVRKIHINSKDYLNKSQIGASLAKNYFKGKQIKVNSAPGLRGFEVFKIEIEGDVPNNVPKLYTFIRHLKKSNFFLLPIDFNQALNIDSKIMFGGIYNYREYDYYFIYRFDGEVFKLIFDGRDVNRGDLKIGYYRDDDCIEYQPNRLIYRYDGKKSIFFDGIVKRFCQAGVDRDPKIKYPISEEKIMVRLDYDGKSWVYDVNSKYKFW